jgi:hypothetical protein
MLEETLNWLTLLFFVGALEEAIRYARKTQALPTVFLVGAFMWSVFVRFAVDVEVPFVSEHTRPLTLVTGILFFGGMFGLNLAWNRFVKRHPITNGPNVAQAARLVVLANEAAARAAKAADNAAETAKLVATIAREAHAATEEANRATKANRP